MLAEEKAQESKERSEGHPVGKAALTGRRLLLRLGGRR
jgi:hypothetical protein